MKRLLILFFAVLSVQLQAQDFRANVDAMSKLNALLGDSLFIIGRFANSTTIANTYTAASVGSGALAVTKESPPKVFMSDGPYSAEACAAIAHLPSPTTALKDKVETLVDNLVSAGEWSKIKYLLIPGQNESNSVCIVTGTAPTKSVTDAPTFIADLYWDGNGSNDSFLNTNWSPDDGSMSHENITIGAFIYTVNTSAGNANKVFAVGNETFFNDRSSDIQFRIMSSGTGTLVGNPTNENLYSVERTNSTDQQLYEGSASVDSEADGSSNTDIGDNIYIFNDEGGGDGTNANVSFVFAATSDIDLGELETEMKTFLGIQSVSMLTTDWETQSLPATRNYPPDDWRTTINGSATVAIVDGEQSVSGTKSVKTVVGTQTGVQRAEFNIENDDFKLMPQGEAWSFEFKMFVPSGHVYDSKVCTLMQDKTFPDGGDDAIATSGVSLRYENGDVKVHVKADDTDPNSSSIDVDTITEIITDITKGSWHSFVMEYLTDPAPAGDGYVKIWHKVGTSRPESADIIYNYTGQVGFYNAIDNYFKLGIYKFGSTAFANNMTLYFDDCIIRKGVSGL